MNHEHSKVSTKEVSSSPVLDLFQASERMQSAPATCVICLESISEKAIALPCAHADFDFACLGAWLQREPSCPLCKAAVHGLKYDFEASAGPKIFSLPFPRPESTLRRASGGNDIRGDPRFRSRRYGVREQHGSDEDDGLERRRQVYNNRTYSLHVGSNQQSRYRNLVPQAFKQDATLIHRAKIWIRRELQVFEFLNPESPPQGPPEGPATRRPRNAEFLGEYILAIIRSIDIRGSTGQAEELLQEFLGRENARLFLHELGSWLRSPHKRLQDWDESVQYSKDAFPSGS